MTNKFEKNFGIRQEEILKSINTLGGSMLSDMMRTIEKKISDQMRENVQLSDDLVYAYPLIYMVCENRGLLINEEIEKHMKQFTLPN